jgi:hypothetical protein
MNVALALAGKCDAFHSASLLLTTNNTRTIIKLLEMKMEAQFYDADASVIFDIN